MFCPDYSKFSSSAPIPLPPAISAALAESVQSEEVSRATDHRDCDV